MAAARVEDVQRSDLLQAALSECCLLYPVRVYSRVGTVGNAWPGAAGACGVWAVPVAVRCGPAGPGARPREWQDRTRAQSRSSAGTSRLEGPQLQPPSSIVQRIPSSSSSSVLRPGSKLEFDSRDATAALRLRNTNSR